MIHKIDAELFGYPGAGKSTVFQALKAEGRFRTPHPISVKRALLYHPVEVSMRYCALQARTRFRAGSTLSSLILRQASTFGMSDRPSIMEEGVIQAVWRTLFWNPEIQKQIWWKDLLRWAGPTVVVLNVTPTTALEHIRTKSKFGPVNAALRDEEISNHRWSSAISAYNMLLDTLLREQEIKTIVLNTENASVEEAHTMIKQSLLG